MSLSSDFFEFIQDQLSSWSDIDKKRMFGVSGIYKDGLMFGIIARDTVYLKVDESNKNKYIDAGSTPLRVFKTNSEVPSYYELPSDILEDAEAFIKWANESYLIQFNKNNSGN